MMNRCKKGNTAETKGMAAATVVSRRCGGVLARSSGKGGRGVAWVAKGKAKTLIVKHGQWWVAVWVSTQRKRG